MSVSPLRAAVPRDAPEASGGLSVLTCSDIHLCLDEMERSIAFPGPVPAFELGEQDVRDLAARCVQLDRDDFLVQHGTQFFRGRRDKRAVDGTWFRLRRMVRPAPKLESLPSPLQPAIVRMLLSEQLKSGGIVYVVGAPASGKTTTASAVVISRLEKFGGVCYTLEDPPELPLNGWHGLGYCSQTWVDGETAEGWADAFRCALRSQPSGSLLMMYVGEVRDAESARALVRAAGSGFLVVATGFATNIVSGIDAFLRLAGGFDGSGPTDLTSSFASLLRLVIHQRVTDGCLFAQFLASASTHSQVANKIRSGQIMHLESDVQQQASEALMGRTPFQNGARR